MQKLYKKSEVLFSVLLIVVYVIGNSILDQVSDSIGIEMIATIPFDILLLAFMFVFIKKNCLSEYYSLSKSRTDIKDLLYYVPLIIVCTVNIWFGFSVRKGAFETAVYIISMLLVGCIEELIFRGFLYKAICRNNVKKAIIVSSILFGIGHIVNLFNGSGMELVANICQLFYAVAIGFLFVSVLYTGKSIIPCMVAHGVFNSLSVFANEAAFEKVQIPVSIALCIISGICAAVIFRNGTRAVKEEK